MRKFLSTFLAGLLLLAQVAQANFIAPVGFLGARAPATTEFAACTTDPADLTTYTFAAHNTGTAAADRTTFVLIMAEDAATAFGVNSVTVGGDAAAELVDEGGTRNINAAIYALANPVGTSEDIVITFSEQVLLARVCVHNAFGLSSLTPVATATDNDTPGALMTLNMNTVAGGAAFGACASNEASETWTWAGLIERSDVGNRTSADLAVATSSTPLSITCQPTTSGGGTSEVGAAVSMQ